MVNRPEYTEVQVNRAAKALYEARYGSVSDYVWRSMVSQFNVHRKHVFVVIEALRRG